MLLQYYENLKQCLHNLAVNRIFALAYSGGLDSRFLAFVGQSVGLQPVLLLAKGVHVAPADTAYALQWAQQRNFSLRVVQSDPLSLPSVAMGARDRCYSCKHALFSQLLRQAEGFVLCDGTQASDTQQYRPGVRALRELGIRSPLAEVGLVKQDIRLLAAQLGMEKPDQGARPCLLTRLPYGVSPQESLLQGLAAAEEKVLVLLQKHYGADRVPDFRIRLVEKNRIELHLQCAEKDGTLPEEFVRCLREELTTVADVPELGAVVPMASISGYFDR